MKRSTITLAVGLMLTAAALKLAFPDGSARMIRTVKDSAAMQETARIETPTDPMPSSVTTVTINAAEFLGEKTEAAPTTDLPAAVEEAVETFMIRQEPFDELSVPANVSYAVDMPSFEYVCPVKAHVSSGFGYRVHPLENLTKFHYGTDLAAQSGDDVVSFAAGTVSEVAEDETYGKYIRIDHADGYSTTYAHCGTVYVSQGQKVTAGEKIALAGATGKVTGPNLHFELKRNGVFLNPEFFFAAL